MGGLIGGVAAAGGQPSLFIHAGLHKTGTTALQESLARHRETLAGRGILYPLAGCPGEAPGQHNLAWQVTRDRRFHSAYGTVDDVAEEIAAHGGDAVISSEDFESVLDRPDLLDRLARHPRLKGYQVVLVIYLREQSSYFKSLFFQLTRDGLTEEVDRLADIVCETGSLRLREWTFLFDYGRAVARLSRWKNGKFILRNYHSLAGGSSVSDFLGVVCPGLVLPQDEAAGRVNEERDLSAALLDFYEGRLPLALTDGQKSLLAECRARLGGGGGQLSLATKRRLAERFKASNRMLKCFGGAHMTFPVPPEGEGAGPTLEQLFSFEMQCRLMGSDPGR
ncbi:MAG TPA: hypothetical protein VMH92_08570 [Acidocella sp.]|nr:hypothetical protein [Acidocella sp.]